LREAAERCLDRSIEPDWLSAAIQRVRPRSGAIRGLFCGGTLCAEAQAIAIDAGLAVRSNAPVPNARKHTEPTLAAHLMLDLGDDAYTRGRPHPMIEPEARTDLIMQALADRQVAVLLLDVVIGYGAHADPAGVVADALARSERNAVQVIASVTGTEQDPQCYSAQRRTLERAGVTVAPSNAHAAELAARLVTS
jgi:predicted TIM-barrel enzyme